MLPSIPATPKQRKSLVLKLVHDEIEFFGHRNGSSPFLVFIFLAGGSALSIARSCDLPSKDFGTCGILSIEARTIEKANEFGGEREEYPG